MIHSQGFLEGLPVFDNVGQLEIRLSHCACTECMHMINLHNSLRAYLNLKHAY